MGKSRKISKLTNKLKQKTMKGYKEIRFYKGRHRPNFWDSLWIMRKIMTFKKGDSMRFEVLFTEESTYTVTPSSDQGDWLKIGGTMTFGNIFIKSNERLIAFKDTRSKHVGGRFQVCKYKRDSFTERASSLWNKKFYWWDVQRTGFREPVVVLLGKKHSIPVGACAGGTGKPDNDFSIYLKIEKE